MVSGTARKCPTAPELVGDPIDVITGAVVDEMWDFLFEGPLRVEWWRAYDSRWFEEDRGLGRGFRHSYEHWLVFDLDGITYRHPRGWETHFPHLTRDGQRERRGGFTLTRLDEHTYRLSRRAQPTRVFRRLSAQASDARLVEVQPPAGDPAQRVVLEYEEGRSGRLSKVLTRAPNGTDETLKVEYDDHGHVVRVVHWAQDGSRTPFVTYAYDEQARLVEATDMYRQRSRYAYTSEGRLAQKTDRRGYSYFYAYDPDGRCVSSHGEDGTNAVSLSYSPLEYETTVLDANGGEWLYQYRPNGVLAFRTDPYGGKRFWKYGSDGRLLAEYDEEGCETRYVHDAAGAPTAKITPDGQAVPIPGPDDPNGHRVPRLPIEFELGDSWDRMFRLPDPHEPVPGLPGAVRSALVTSDDPLRGTIQEVRDAQGLLLREELEDGRKRTYGYNENGGLRRITDFDGATYRLEVESDNHITREVDGEGNATTFAYTATEKVAAIVDPSGVETTYGRDLKDRLTEIRRDGPLRETYSYDAGDRLVEKRDAHGQLMVRLEWDRLGHLVKRSLTSGEDQHYRYDAQGRVTEAFTDTHRCTFAYDWRGRRVEDLRDGEGVTHEYDGDRLASTMVLGRFRIEYRHLPDGTTLLVDPAGGTHRIRRHGRGIITKDFDCGLSETAQFHPRGGKVLRKLLFDRSAGAPTWERHFEYSGEGDLLEVRDSDRGVTRYEHDAAHRLKATTHPDGRSDQYQYNRAGALFEAPTLGQATVGKGNVLRYANGERFEYGHRHHLSKRVRRDGELDFDYDSRDQLAVVFWQGADGTTWGWDAEYDALGRRIRKSPGYSSHHAYFWDSDRLVAEVLPDGRCRVYAYADAFAIVPMMFVDYDSLDAEPSGGHRYYVLTDQRGCAERVLDSQGNDAWRARIDPYGYAHVEVGQNFYQPLRFPGHWYDPELGLQYNRFRYYSPELGRYLEVDPWGLKGGVNLYAYTSNPLTQVDLRGLCPKTSVGGGDDGEPRQRPDAEGEGEPGDGAPRDDDGTLRHDPERAQLSPEQSALLDAAHRKALAAEAIQDGRRDSKCVAINGGTHLSGYNTEGQPHPGTGYTDGPGRDPRAAVAHDDAIGHPRHANEGLDPRVVRNADGSEEVHGASMFQRNQDGNVVRDQDGNAQRVGEHLQGGADAGHAERQAHMAQNEAGTNDPVGVGTDQCGGCRGQSRRHAMDSSRPRSDEPVVVGDPEHTRVYNSDGSVDVYRSTTGEDGTVTHEYLGTASSDTEPGPRPGGNNYRGVPW